MKPYNLKGPPVVSVIHPINWWTSIRVRLVTFSVNNELLHSMKPVAVLILIHWDQLQCSTCHSPLLYPHCNVKLICFWCPCQVRIQDLVKGGPQVLRLKVADVAKHSRASEASNLRPRSRALKWALEAFGFLMLKYAFSHILGTLFL